MNINKNFVLKKIDDEYVLIPLGQEVMNIKGMLKINEVGAAIFNYLNDGLALDEIVKRLAQEYQEKEEIIRNDAVAFIDLLIKYGVYK